MIELIALIAAIAVLILTPIEVAKIQKGWVRKSFKGTHEQFVAAYRKQLTFMIWIGVVLGVLNIGLGVIEQTPGENYVKYFAGLLWLGVSAMSYFSRNKLAAMPPSTPTAA
jgi:hypothetical protein